MNLAQIRSEAWDIAREIGTTESTRLWRQSEMNRYINRTCRHIAKETKCIRDSVTASLCRIASSPPASIGALTTLAATDAWAAQDLAWYNSSTSWLSGRLVAPYSYPLSQLVVDIDECKWSTRQWKLTKVSVSKWRSNPWWEQVVGMPTEYATDGDNGRLFINFRSDTSDTLKLAVRRLPLLDLANDTDEPEFRTHYHDFIVNGVLWQMYSKQDAETFDLSKSGDFKGAFLKDLDEIKQQESIINSRLLVNNALDGFR
jgi:hypothetical protein